MPHWSCSSSLCHNNYSTLDKNGAPIKKYKLPSDPQTREAYLRFFKNESFDWDNGFICAAHWSSGQRLTSNHLPDVLVSEQQFANLELKHARAKKIFQAAKTPSSKQRMQYQNSKKKLDAARSAVRYSVEKPSRPAPKLRESCTITAPETTSEPTISPTPSTSTVTDVAPQNDAMMIIESLKQQLEEKDAKISKLEQKVAEKSRRINELNIAAYEKTQFSFLNIAQNPEKFEYLTGLSLQRFGLVLDCVRPYIEDCLRFDGRKATETTFTFATQYLIVMMVARHGLDFRFAAFMCNVSEQTIGRIYNGWVVFLATIFNQLDQRPDQLFMQKKMPEIFIRTGHGSTDLVLDATEFKFQNASNFDISTLMFSHYKNTTTGKALIGISPHGMGMVFSEIYPGSISDTEITEKTDILSYVSEDHEIMTDRGFAIQDLCAIKGISLNRPKQKDAESNQFTQGEIHRNFDIAATRIHVERYIGRVRNWKILNRVWPLNRADLMTSTWQMLCHTVNLVFPPIGPKIEEVPKT